MSNRLTRPELAARLLPFVALAASALLAACGGAPPASRAPVANATLISARLQVATPTIAPPQSLPTKPPTVVAVTPMPSPTSTPPPTPSPAITPTIDVAAVINRSHVPILCYHHIRNWLPGEAQADKEYIVPVDSFRAQMDDLAKNGWHTISPDQLQAFLTSGKRLPDKPVMVTFDDGDVNQWTNAVPELRKHHFTATFFIMTVVLDKPNYLSTDQVKALDQMGMTIGAHTWDHHRVTRYTEPDWVAQITKPTKQLEEITGHPIKIFAYPYGLWNQAAIPHLKQAGFDAAYQLAEKTDPAEPLYTIRRVIANGFWSIPQFEEAITSWF